MSDRLLEYKLDLIAEALNVYRIETVTAVMRRQHVTPEDGTIVDVLDFFPAWNEWGTYGKMKVAHEYLDNDWQRERFEKFAGVKVNDIPLYEGQTALVRRFGVTHKCEVAVRPFRLMLQPRKDENGNYDKTLILRYLTSPQARQNTPQMPPAPATAPVRVQTPPPPEPETAVPPAAPRTQPNPIEKDWELEAANSSDPLMFDTALAKAVPWFKDGNGVQQFREVIFGDAFQPQHTPAYVRGLQAYARERKAANGNREAHNRAKTKAIEAFRTELGDSSAPVGVVGGAA
ncbi:MAG: hypothetical protein H6662_15440 [Ardenticatenaceae bacterium]|nr:hypothetical protein [Anaerolineales bacterium]MCB8922980.1 hypothetical protein [Ardenticatenaceae bacterium]MCB8990287.1 hypothetical protein [Ardenticatenaceae bacterium]